MNSQRSCTGCVHRLDVDFSGSSNISKASRVPHIPQVPGDSFDFPRIPYVHVQCVYRNKGFAGSLKVSRIPRIPDSSFSLPVYRAQRVHHGFLMSSLGPRGLLGFSWIYMSLPRCKECFAFFEYKAIYSGA